MRVQSWFVLAALLALPLACSEDDRPAAAGSGASSSGASSHAGKSNGRSSGQGQGGEATASEGGVGAAEGGAPMAGSDPIGHLGGLGPANTGGSSNPTPA